MTLLLLQDLQVMWTEIMVALVQTIPAFVGIWVFAWIFRSLLMGKD